MKEKGQIGVAGLAVMGENLALNMANKGFTVSVYNRTTSKTDHFMQGRAQGKPVRGYHGIADFIAGMTDRFALREHERLSGRRLLP